MGSSPLYLAIVVVWLIVLVPMLLRRDAADPVRRADQGALDEAGVESESLDEEDEEDEEDEDGEYAADASDPDDAPHRQPAMRTAVDTLDEVTDGVGADTATELPVPRRRRAETDSGDEAHTVTHTHAEPLPPPALPRVSRARIIARRRRRTSGLVLLLAGTGVAVGLDLGPWWVLVPPTLLILGHLALLREAAKADTERRAAMARRRRRLHAQRTAEAAREAEVIELMSRRNQVYDQYADAHLRAAGD